MGYGLVITAALAVAQAQGLSDVRHLYDAGRFKEVIAAVEQTPADADARPRLQYLAAQSEEKLGDAGAAREIYQSFIDSADPAWAAIGRAARALLDKQLDAALDAANEAVASGKELPEAQYERGLVLMSRRDYAEAASAFDTATTLDPLFAAAHYYGGLAEYRAKRIDRMAAHFEAFLKLAPDAPERPEVESIMRTVRGR